MNIELTSGRLIDSVDIARFFYSPLGFDTIERGGKVLPVGPSPGMLLISLNTGEDIFVEDPDGLRLNEQLVGLKKQPQST